MQIHGLNKTTLLDYPEHLAATIFTGGCNFRCPFCHNKSLVLSPNLQPTLSDDSVMDFLKKRQGILAGVCITGGEPTLQQDLFSFLEKIKQLGYLIKLDTNGYRPEVLKNLVANNLIDYVALDIKSSLTEYHKIACVNPFQISLIKESVSFLMSGNIDYEFRTTIVKELHSIDTISDISDWISGCKAYFLQNFEESDEVITQGFHSHNRETLESFISLLQEKIPSATLRGLD